MSAPPGWTERSLPGLHCYDSAGGLRAIVSVDEINGAEWLHLSVSRKSRTPSYEDLLLARRVFLDPAKPSYQVFPRAAEYRSLEGNNALHLWQPLGVDPFPDPLLERADMVAPPGNLSPAAALALVRGAP